MYRNPLGFVGCLAFALVSLLVAGPALQVTSAGSGGEQAGSLRVGWASTNLTPEKPVVLNATHTHCAPETRTKPDLAEKLGTFGLEIPLAWSGWGIDLGAMSPVDYLEFAGDRIAKAIQQAWKSRKPGGVSFGMSHAVLGHNRLAAYTGGGSRMYGKTDQSDFSHVKGYEDHSVNLLYAWNADRKLTGVLINVAVPSQASGGSRISGRFNLVGNQVSGFDEAGAAALLLEPDRAGRQFKNIVRGNMFLDCTAVVKESRAGLWESALKDGNISIGCDGRSEPEAEKKQP